uniref:Enhancer of polycomb-like protein n=1 Tax=Ascaris lumbricoides TaxID=6252 RepID=A0A0M3IHD6_ASCLU
MTIYQPENGVFCILLSLLLEKCRGCLLLVEMTRSRRKVQTKQKRRRKMSNEEIEVARDLSVMDATVDRIQVCVEHSDYVQLIEENAETNAVNAHRKEDKVLPPTLTGEELWFLDGYTGPGDPLSLLEHVCVDKTIQSWDQFLSRLLVDYAYSFQDAFRVKYYKERKNEK